MRAPVTPTARLVLRDVQGDGTVELQVRLGQSVPSIGKRTPDLVMPSMARLICRRRGMEYCVAWGGAARRRRQKQVTGKMEAKRTSVVPLRSVKL